LELLIRLQKTSEPLGFVIRTKLNPIIKNGSIESRQLITLLKKEQDLHRCNWGFYNSTFCQAQYIYPLTRILTDAVKTNPPFPANLR